jgi:hypothetical protein
VQELASGGAKLTNLAPNPDASQGRTFACPEAGVLINKENYKTEGASWIYTWTYTGEMGGVS